MRDRPISSSPRELREMIAEYHRLLRSGYHWGGGAEVTVGLLRHVRFVPLERLLAEARLRLPDDQKGPGAEDAVWLQDFDDVLRTCLAGNVPRDLTVLHATSAGVRFETGPLPVVITGGAVEGSLLVDSSLERPLELRVGGTSLTVGEMAARLLPFSASPGDPVLRVEIDGEGFRFGPSGYNRPAVAPPAALAATVPLVGHGRARGKLVPHRLSREVGLPASALLSRGGCRARCASRG